MWMTNNRLIVWSPGNSPPKNSDASHVPATGMEMAML
jgi:hypothetical protein